jgi:lipopolysaccharide/colanic/teichoic acid biosynthesis glycosyltransferase
MITQKVSRRVLNIAAAAILLAVAVPVMLLIAIAVKLTSKGSIIYKQTRIGVDRRSIFSPPRSNLERRVAPRQQGVDRRKSWYAGMPNRRAENVGGKPFTIYKFRTMAVGTKNAVEQWATQNDARVTPVGKILRKYRLDELPQFVNVLLGDMNVVGPRPEQPKIFESLKDEVFGYWMRQQVHPGITGLAQISQSYDTCIEDVKSKVRYDLEYMVYASAGYDASIMLKTIPAVLLHRRGW